VQLVAEPGGSPTRWALGSCGAEGGRDGCLRDGTERTRRTARPLADALGLEPLIYQVGTSDQIRGFAGRLQREHGGDVVLVVGHNPTVPRTIDALGGNAADCSVGAAYDEFDDLRIVAIYGAGAVKVLNLQYGKPSL
jgi:broad specificity phosphatase PhoE